MNKRFALLLIGLLAVLSLLAWGAGTETCIIRGTVLDHQGKPVAGAVIAFTGVGTGTKYSTKTDGKGYYTQIGVKAGTYRVDVSKDGKVLWTLPAFEVHFGTNVSAVVALQQDASYTNTLNINLGETSAAGGAPAVPLSDAEKQALEELQKQAAAAPPKDAKLVRQLNDKIQSAQSAEAQGKWDSVISILSDVTHSDPMDDGAWAAIGLAYLQMRQYDQAAGAYVKAVAINPGVGAYHQNLAVAYSKTGHVDEAAAAFQSAATVDPPKAASYYLYAGMLLSNNSRNGPALEMLNKAIAADPKLADAYYFKGYVLMQGAQMEDGKLVPPAGAADAFKKYLELEPSGSHADAAKMQLGRLGD